MLCIVLGHTALPATCTVAFEHYDVVNNFSNSTTSTKNQHILIYKLDIYNSMPKHQALGANYKKILRLSYDVIITYDNRKSNLR